MLSIMKKILLSLFVLLIWLINFWYCSTVDYNWEYLYLESVDTWTVNLLDYETVVSYNNVKWYTYCALVKFTPIDSSKLFQLIFNPWAFGSSKYTTYNVYWNDWVSSLFICWDSNPSSSTDLSLTFIKWDIDNYEIDYRIYKVNQSEDPNVIEWLLQSCSSDLQLCNNDLHSCQNNNVCIPWSWDNWSALYINDIQHLGKPIINITFPDYLDWDYTTTENEFNLDIVWYSVDTEYIDWIIRTQNYKPTSEDFTQLVWMLAPYSKYLLFLLFIFIIWAWIKKPFKSKKL